jgi:hypothetical protein
MDAPKVKFYDRMKWCRTNEPDNPQYIKYVESVKRATTKFRATHASEGGKIQPDVKHEYNMKWYAKLKDDPERWKKHIEYLRNYNQTHNNKIKTSK